MAGYKATVYILKVTGRGVGSAVAFLPCLHGGVTPLPPQFSAQHTRPVFLLCKLSGLRDKVSATAEVVDAGLGPGSR